MTWTMNSRKLSRLLIDGDTKLRCAFNRVKVVMGKDQVSCTCTKEEVIHDAEVLCNDYVEDRLIRSGLQLKKRKIGNLNVVNENESRDSSPAITPTMDRPRSVTFRDKSFDKKSKLAPRHDVEAVSKVLLYVGEVLELRHASTYTDVLSQLSIATLSEFQLKRAFNTVAREMFAAGISWAKIVSLFAFAGGLSVDCVMNGSGVMVSKIKGWTVTFVASELADWIRARGGWTDFVDHFVVGGKITYDFMAWLFLFVCIMLVVMTCVLVTVTMPRNVSTSFLTFTKYAVELFSYTYPMQ